MNEPHKWYGIMQIPEILEHLRHEVLRDEAIDTLVHFAAKPHVDHSIYGSDAFLKTNIDGTHGLLKAAKTVWLDEKPGFVHRFHHVSTDEVYSMHSPHHFNNLL